MVLERLTKSKIKKLLPYFKAQSFRLCNYSAGVAFMWGKVLSLKFAIVNDCLVLMESYGKLSGFYYPLNIEGDSEKELLAISEIEKYCKENKQQLCFTNIPKSKISQLILKYGADARVYNSRRWRDYIYPAENFKSYPGGAFSGQRNHVNKFKKTYPDYKFVACACNGDCSILNFLNEYEGYQLAKGDFSASVEMQSAKEILPYVKKFGMVCGYITVGDKVIAVSVGERCGDTLIVHIEKALHEYAGVYPTIAQEFAKAFAVDGINYLNREDDSGDLGLRKSKLNYLPSDVADKFFLTVNRPIDSLSKSPEIKTDRLTLKAVPDKDVAEYARLCRDLELNKFWGYDWHEDTKDACPDDKWFLKSARHDFKIKDEIPLGIYSDTTLVGEVVLYNFGYSGEAEIGVRLLNEYRGQGFAKESLIAYMRYGFSDLNLEKIEAKCYKENLSSAKALQAAGMRKVGEDDVYYYFIKTPAM